MLATSNAFSITFTTVARASGVTRQTLYTRWETPQRLVASAILNGHTGAHPKQHKTLAATTRSWYLSVIDGLSDPGRAAALSALISFAQTDPVCSESLNTIVEDRRAAFNALVSRFGLKLSEDDFAIASGPIFHALFFDHRRPPKALVDWTVATVEAMASHVGD